ncbi:hypothetical protein ABFS82_08G074500 [Erythranthe guttata]|uniref:Uncharacterized protein n=1 Tax=Erythranthe guttata TaxID=4155 RepID=A0A022RX90_ERYGU|nr:PREDICTED: uncharacterized protein LOC105974540 [Erythranthe guttata]XP_012855116.1 PREDICTED: uncharacterized protein LOC105974540 [Erythranthe guttata]EYU44674.1 hypothetical protein MIMGU_mgv1a017434mg [Erythranthe guttata]|eukprot:XP_012855110.1 PREDICTED: uncharacterized protein LOC105974540 [Erythranthe guttata]
MNKNMNWVQRKVYLYNVTFGLYMLDWWERFLFNALLVVLMWFVCYNGVRSASEFCTRFVTVISPRVQGPQIKIQQ